MAQKSDEVRKNMPILFDDGDNIILRMTEIDDLHSVGASLSFNYKPVKWIVIQPYYNYEYLTYTNSSLKINISA